MNPFSLRYFRTEKNSLVFEPTTLGNVKLDYHDYHIEEFMGYMYQMKDVTLSKIPVLTINEQTWMSLTPLEIESHYMPIQLAEGRVGVAGLGMGYYTQRILDKETVKEVVVYELNPHVIDMYHAVFGHHPKLTIIQGDVLKVKNETFDFFYNDIYPFALDKSVVKDMIHITKNNNISLYHFWTQEALIKELAINNYPIPVEWIERYKPFFDYYKSILNYTSKFPQKLNEASDYYYKQLKNSELYHKKELALWELLI